MCNKNCTACTQKSCQKIKFETGCSGYACNLDTWEAEAPGLLLFGGQCEARPCLTKNKQTKKNQNPKQQMLNDIIQIQSAKSITSEVLKEK